MKQSRNKKRFELTDANPTVSRYVSEGNPNTDVVIEKAENPSFDETLVKQTNEVIAREESLPEEARHIVVTAQDGKVILKGKVHTEQERMVLGDKAAAVAGFGNVKNLIEVTKE